MIGAALALHEAAPAFGAAGRKATFLSRAVAWAVGLETHFRDPATGLLTMAAADATDIVARLSPTQDDAVPNAHGLYALALPKLAAFTFDESWVVRFDALMTAVAPAMRAAPMGHLSLFNALDQRLAMREIVVAGDDRAALLTAAFDGPLLNRSIIELEAAQTLPPHHPAQAQRARAGTATAYLCRDGACEAPLSDPSLLGQRLRA